MADIKWIKLSTNMHDDEKMKLIDAMPKRDTIHYVWIRILLLGGKLNANGEIFLSEGKPLTAKMLAVLFSRSLEDIKLALKVLSRFGMIEIAPNKVIKIVNWEKHQNIEGMERVREQNRKRAENYREKKKLDEKASQNNKENDANIFEAENLDEMEADENKPKDDFETNESIAIDSDDKSKIDSEDPAKNNSNNDEIADLNSIKNNKNKGNITQKNSNVTKNESNAIVTEQNKKEIENKKKRDKKDIEIENTNLISKINNETSTSQKVNSVISMVPEVMADQITTSHKDDDINASSMRIMFYYQKITGIPGGAYSFAIRKAIDTYGEKVVKMAIDTAFDQNQTGFKYINGILKNWKRDGYPKEDKEVKKNGVRSYGKNIKADKNEFAGFKPKESRKLTEAERKRIHANLI
ncbi:replisome organizer region-containing protein [Clostridium sp. DL-VIII]|uniref:phage replisome organizer N-terminal domain-containing protein n=1 Tax=Clostridium sp. DL-VIII TaxID=641107 RepID=UPI00023AF9BC|nr:phage replisome organizer N-terminal domain-containing protein [Clostridium sp. DL-VIII]EHI98737.1 replisome organizer region-containing protein [Clostridium sp. DL-VIII]